MPDPISTWIDLEEHPVVNGMFMVIKSTYNIEVPFKGLPLLRVFLKDKLPDEAKPVVDRMKQVFENHQELSLKTPVKWVTVGYVYGFDLELKPTYRRVGNLQINSGTEFVPVKDINGNEVIGTTVYYQLSNPGFALSDQVWSNWPAKPEVFRGSVGVQDPSLPVIMPPPPLESYPPDLRDL